MAARVFVDLLDRSAHTKVDVDVCIVGAGAAGITLACELARHRFDVVLLEAGGLKLESETQDLYRGESVGLTYGALDATRIRYLGGSTNPEGWGGWCKPLDPIDFEDRAWVPYSGWPLGIEELERWYRRAQEVCESGPFDYDLESWRRHLGGLLGDLPLSGGRVATQLAQLSPPVRFGRRYRGELAAARNVTVYLHANTTRVVMDGDGSTAKCVEATTLDGRRLSVACRLVILSAGGIENARLLLLSNGLGNGHDLVGRFFMDHPCIEIGSIDLGEGGLPDLYDPYYKFRKRNRSAGGVYDRSLIAGSLSLTPETQRTEELLNYRAWIVPTFRGEDPATLAAMKRLYIGLSERALPASVRQDIGSLLRRPDHSIATIVARYLRPKRLVRSYRLVNILEPDPAPESRVMLSDKADSLGLARVRLDWRVGRLVQHTLATAHEVLDEDLKSSGLGRLVDPYRPGDESRFLGALGWVWHHMGTTRMHVDPEGGVVNPDCRVHSTTNVYVAGSSVFPTSGNDMPTLTIVALALRLADHVVRRLAGEEADLHDADPSAMQQSVDLA